MSRSVYLTGFEPFLAIRENPTEALARSLDGQRFGDLIITSRVLPVAWEQTPKLLAEDRARLHPDVCVHLGVSGQAKVIRLERFAYNTIRSSVPDNEDKLPEEQVIDPGLPLDARRETTLPVSMLLTRLDERAIPAEISIDPGRYLCNRAYYESLRLDEAPALFVHVPHTDNVDPSGERWTLGRLRAAMESILEGLSEAMA